MNTVGQCVKHGDTSPCIDREEQELCEWAFNSGDPRYRRCWLLELQDVRMRGHQQGAPE